MSKPAKSKKAVTLLFLFICFVLPQFILIGKAMPEIKGRTQEINGKNWAGHEQVMTMKIQNNQTQKGKVFMSKSANSKKTVTVSTSEKKPLRFIFITPFVDINFFLPVKKGIKDAAKQLGVLCEFTGPEGGDTEIQVEMVRQAIADGYDGIALNIIDSAGLTGVIDEAVNAGIPVVAFNVDDQSVPTRRLCAVCQNLFEAGTVLGKEASSFIDNDSKILILMHDEGVSALDQRFRGITKGLQGKNITWEVMVTGDAENTVRMVTEKLKAESDIKAVLCTGQSDTEGAGLAIERNFKGRDCKVAGFDLSEDTLRMVKEGTISFVIDQQPYLQGYYPVVQLTHYCRFGIIPSNIDAGSNMITQETAGRVIELSKKSYR